MADRGRDLKVSILSDASKFDLGEPADQLEKLGDNSKSAGTQIESLERDVKDASGSLENFGRDAKDVAEKVDNAFDAIARSSKASMRQKLDEDSDKAKRSLKEVGEEANDTARETAASFDGSAESVSDAFQEIAANAFAALGPIGAAAGLAAAAGLGFLRKKAEEAKEKVNELTSALIDENGKLSTGTVFDRIAASIEDGSLQRLAEQAKSAGVSVDTLTGAFDGNLSSIQNLIFQNENWLKQNEKTIESIRNKQRSSELNVDVLTEEEHAILGNAQAKEILNATLRKEIGAVEKATKNHELFKDVTGASIETFEGYQDALRGVSDETLAWSETTDKSVDKFIKDQQRAIKASLNFEENTQKVLRNLGEEAVQWANEQGDSADEAMQFLANAPKKKQAQIAANFRTLREASERALRVNDPLRIRVEIDDYGVNGSLDALENRLNKIDRMTVRPSVRTRP